MQRYSPERKEAVLRKMAPPHNLTVAGLAAQAKLVFASYNLARIAGLEAP